MFLSYYLAPASDTFSNALQSALKAGYEQEYAESITAQMPTWLSESLGDQDLLRKAEENLKYVLELETLGPAIGMFGPIKDKETGEIFMKENTGLLKVKADVSKFVAERLGRKKYATRQEHTGKNGDPIAVGVIYLPQRDQSRMATEPGTANASPDHQPA